MSLTILPLHIIDGIAQNDQWIPGLFVVQNRHTAVPAREKDVLLLHITANGGPAKTANHLQDELLDLFTEAYYSTHGDTTVALRRALDQVHQYLLEANSNTLTPFPYAADLCAAAICDTELHIIQVGQTKALIGHNFGLEWMPEEQPTRIARLGVQSGVDVRLFHTWLEDGEIILILDPQMIDIPSEQFSSVLVNQQLEEAGHIVHQLLDARSARLILAQMITEPIIEQNKQDEQQEDAFVSPIQRENSSVSGAMHLHERYPDDAVTVYDPPSIARRVEPVAQTTDDTDDMDSDSWYDREGHDGYNEDDVENMEQYIEDMSDADATIAYNSPTYLRESAEQVNPSREQADEQATQIDLDRDGSLSHRTGSQPRVSRDYDAPDSERRYSVDAIRQRRRAMIRQRTMSIDPADNSDASATGASHREYPDSAHLASEIEHDNPERSNEYDKYADRYTYVEEEIAKGPGVVRRGGASILYWLSDRVRGMARLVNQFNSADDATATERWLSLAFAFLTPLIVMGIIMSTWIQGEQRQLVNDIKKDVIVASQYVDLVETSSQKRVYYDYILEQLDIAERYVQDDGEIASWKQMANTQMDRVRGMVSLSGSQLVDYGNDVKLSAFAPSTELDLGFYTLDIRNNQVLYVPNNNPDQLEPTVAIQGQDAAGNHLIGDIVDILWRETPDGLALLDRTGAFVTEYAESGERDMMAMGMASTWINPVRMMTYAERVYVLDTGNSPANARIWRYLQGETGLIIDSANPSISFDDLDQAVDFAITKDGTVIVLYYDGRIRRYATSDGGATTLWDEQDVYASGLSEPMRSPLALTISESGFQPAIFVLDPGTKRVLQISTAGTLDGQYRAQDRGNGRDLIASAVDLSVETSPMRLYLMTENGLYLATE